MDKDSSHSLAEGGRGARRPSGLQELLRHKVKVPEGSLLASGEGTLGCRWGQGWRQAGELPLEVAKVCRATESGHKGRPDSASKQGLPVGGLRTRMESLRRWDSRPQGTLSPPTSQALETAGSLTLKNGWTLISSASCSPAPRRFSGHFWRSWQKVGQVGT